MAYLIGKRRRRSSTSRAGSAGAHHASPPPGVSILHHLLLSCVTTLVLLASLAGASKSSASGIEYPVANLGPSLAASAAASTVVAVTASSGSSTKEGEEDGEDGAECCTVILTKSLPEAEDEEDDVDAGLMISSLSEQEQELLQPLHAGRYSPSLSVLSTTTSPLLLALTGFSPDAHHLSLSAAKLYSDHRHLYGGTAMRTDKLANRIADRMSLAARSDGGRPFGVQALVVGDRLVGKGAEMQLYTIDPAGGCRHWSGGGTVVGRDADLVRRCLDRCLRPRRSNNGGSADKNGRGQPRDWTEALDRAIMATIEASSSEGQYDEDVYAKSGRYRAVVAFARGSGAQDHGHESKCFEIDSKWLEISYQRCVRWLDEEVSDRKNRRPHSL